MFFTIILIYLSKRELELKTFSSRKCKLYISVITYMEALGFPFKNAYEKTIIRQLCNHLEIIPETLLGLRPQGGVKVPEG